MLFTKPIGTFLCLRYEQGKTKLGWTLTLAASRKRLKPRLHLIVFYLRVIAAIAKVFFADWRDRVHIDYLLHLGSKGQ